MGIFNKVKENKKFEPRNTRETPMKHPGKVHSLMFCIKGAGLEKTSLAKVVGIFNKVKENKKFEPGNTRETPGKSALTNVFNQRSFRKKKLL